jgi:hypothetical protein
MGKGGWELHKWFDPTRIFRSMIRKDGGTDDRFARATAEGFRGLHPWPHMFAPTGADSVPTALTARDVDSGRST